MKLFARNQFTGILKKADKNVYRLPFKPDSAALPPEFARTHVKLEDPEPDGAGRWYSRSH